MSEFGSGGRSSEWFEYQAGADHKSEHVKDFAQKYLNPKEQKALEEAKKDEHAFDFQDGEEPSEALKGVWDAVND